MILGYFILLALATGFLFLGVKGFSPAGLPLTRKKNLTGGNAKIVGAICILLGLNILGLSIFDFLAMFGPRTEKTVNIVENQMPIPVVKPVEAIKPPGKPLEGLIAYWTFDEIDGAKILDFSGRGNHAVLHGGKNVPGVKGAAICLNGKEDWIDYGDSADFNFGAFSPFTISGWIKTNQTKGTILSKRNSQSGWPSLRMDIRTAFLGVYLHGATEGIPGAGIQGSTIINDDKWHHFAFVRFGEEWMRLHIDGKIAGLDRSRWVTQALTTDMRSLGSDRRWVMKMEGEFLEHPWYQGCLDEFCVFNRALDDNEVNRLASLDVDALPKGAKKEIGPAKVEK